MSTTTDTLSVDGRSTVGLSIGRRTARFLGAALLVTLLWFVGLAVTSHAAGVITTATFAAASISGNTAPPPVATQTMVFLRHGEKPAGGFGQITCQGLRRALALPDVLIGRFGPPQYIFAPNPSPRIIDPGGPAHYVRPLATIEPTAIRLGMPVNAQYGFQCPFISAIRRMYVGWPQFAMS